MPGKAGTPYRTPQSALATRGQSSHEHLSLLTEMVGVRSEAGRNIPVGELREALVASVCFPPDEVGKET
jgi:hypothetical protein